MMCRRCIQRRKRPGRWAKPHTKPYALEASPGGAPPGPRAGVYQEVMGSAHNMLGATNVVEVRLAADATSGEVQGFVQQETRMLLSPFTHQASNPMK